MRYFSDLAGTLLSFFKFGTLQIKDSSGTLEVRDRADTTYAGLTCSTLSLNPDASFTAIGRVPQWVKVTIPYSVFADASTENTVTIFALPAAGFMQAFSIKHSVPFSGGSISAYEVSIGTESLHGKYTAPFDVFQDVTNIAYLDSEVGGSENFGAPVNIVMTATSTGDTLDNATAGSLDVWVLCGVRV